MSHRSAAPSESGSLGESTYEFIDTDEESRDDNATESVASTDFGRPEDVASIADHSADESGDEQPPISSIPALLEQSVNNAFGTPTIEQSSAGAIFEDIDRPLAQSIEFEEPFTLEAETVSVKHTIADYTEEQTASIVHELQIQSPPSRLLVTIRQTMTKQGLSTKDPLRILYVGSHSAKKDIIHKIASSVTASVNHDKRAEHLQHSPSQLYNVVPVSEFGSERTPEIELMHSSGYQIKVEDCTSAQSLQYEDSPEKPDVLKLTLDDNFAHHSVPDNETFIIQPSWELPHVAIFYCTDSDNADMRRTRAITRKFMSRHAVPSIVISHKQLFKGQCMTLDQHSVHMCLESRDPNGRGNVIHQRLPIDLNRFLNIDARQMNRNLAYLTGLHSLSEDKPSPPTKKVLDELVNPLDLEKTKLSMSDSVNFLRNKNGAEWRALLPVGLLLISVFAAVLTGIPSYRASTAPAISINSKVMSAVPLSTLTASTTAPRFNPTSTFPSVAVKTSTRTVTVTESQPQESNSLALLPSMELGRFSQKHDNQAKPVNKPLVCTAESLGDREILIRIPSSTKLSWLTQEAMSVNISRGNITVDTERVYSCDDGIVLLLAKEDAWGVLDIAVVTSKKPRINETFQVDLGMTTLQTIQNFFDRISGFSPLDVAMAHWGYKDTLDDALDNFTYVVREKANIALANLGEVRQTMVIHTSTIAERCSHLARNVSLGVAKHSAIVTKEAKLQLEEAERALWSQLESLQRLRKPMGYGLLRAQVSSKLLWLKLRREEAEYQDYNFRANEALCSTTADPATCWRNFLAKEKPTNVETQSSKAKGGKKFRNKDRAAKNTARNTEKATKKSNKKARKIVRDER